jgi:hypothetical protein
LRTVVAREESCRELHFFVSTRPATEAEAMAGWVRAHWEVENGLHQRLDCVLHEDATRVGNGPGAQNLAVVRRVALAALKADTTFKASMPRRVRQAAHDDTYMTFRFTWTLSPNFPMLPVTRPSTPMAVASSAAHSFSVQPINCLVRSKPTTAVISEGVKTCTPPCPIWCARCSV